MTIESKSDSGRAGVARITYDHLRRAGLDRPRNAENLRLVQIAKIEVAPNRRRSGFSENIR